MRRPHSALLRARALLIAGLVVVGPSLLAAGPVAAGRGSSGAAAAAAAADARGGSRTLTRSVKLHGAAGAARAENRPARHVVARTLPKATGKEKVYTSKHAAPPMGAARGSGSGSAKAPSSFPTTALAPTPATVTTTNPATEATSGAGTAQTTAEPPDAAVAVGPEHVVQATNEGIRITSRTLGLVSNASLFNFFGLDFDPDYQAATFDPHVIFDSVHNRWLATEASFDCVADPDFDIFVGTGYIDIAISDTADPTGGWSILSAPYPDTVPDYPGLGTSTDKIVVSSNVFPLVASGGLGCDIDEDHFVGTELDAVTWAQMLGSGNVDVAYLTDYISPVDYGHYGDPVNNLPASLDYFTMRPALQAPAASATVFGVGLNVTNGKPSAFRITGLPSSGTTAVTIADVAGLDAFDADPPAPAQPGGTIASAVDGRPTDAIWQANRLAFVSTMTCDPAGGATGETRDCVRVSELSTATATATVKQDMVIGETGRDLYMGGIGFSQNSDLHVVWTGSSATASDYPSTYTAYQLSGQTVNTLTGKQKIASGTAAYGGTGFGSRWGDYVTVAQDPQVPDAVWQADEYSVGTWATRVSQLRTFGGSSYFPIAPVRVMDSRSPGIGIPTPVMFTANIPQKFKVRGAFGIPTGAVAVTGNIGVVGQQVAGYVSVTPTSTTAPTTSTINFPLKDVRANNFTLPIGADGNLWAVFKGSSGKKTHLFVDITGYFVAGSAGATYQPITPVTRMGNSIDGSGGLVRFTGTKLSQQLILKGVGPIPADATAVTGNVTITRQTTGGFISVTKDAPSFPLTTSTLNFPKGDNRANGLTAALNASGGIWITLSIPTTATADVLVDITGYYKSGGGGKLFYPLTPGRPLDTRAGVVLSGLTGAFAAQPPPPTALTNARTLTVGGHWGVPAGATAITGNITVTGQTQAGFVSVTPTADNNPGTSTINFPLGDVRANGVTSPLSGGSLGLVYRSTVGKTTHLILDVTGYFK